MRRPMGVREKAWGRVRTGDHPSTCSQRTLCGIHRPVFERPRRQDALREDMELRNHLENHRAQQTGFFEAERLLFMSRVKLVAFGVLLLAGMVLAAFAPAFADGGPLILCPPRSKTCVCTLPRC